MRDRNGSVYTVLLNRLVEKRNEKTERARARARELERMGIAPDAARKVAFF